MKLKYNGFSWGNLSYGNKFDINTYCQWVNGKGCITNLQFGLSDSQLGFGLIAERTLGETFSRLTFNFLNFYFFVDFRNSFSFFPSIGFLFQFTGRKDFFLFTQFFKKEGFFHFLSHEK